MEGLINPYKSNVKVKYAIFTKWSKWMMCSADGIFFIRDEEFQLKEKIAKLDSIVEQVLDKLKETDSDNIANIIDTINEKRDLLKDILKEYKKIKNKYIGYDKFYRLEVFQFYKNEYDNIIFDIFKKEKYFLIGLDIQKLLRDKFTDFFHNYSRLIDRFIEINNYIVKIKILFNIQE